MNRVVITGLGIVSALGHSRDSFWRSLTDGRCAIESQGGPEFSGLRFRYAAKIRDFETHPFFDQRSYFNLDPFAHFFLAACRQALADGGVVPGPQTTGPAALISGTAGGGQVTLDRGFERLYAQGKGVSPLTIPCFMPHAGLSRVSQELMITGPSFTVTTACAAGTQALGLAYHLVRSGQVPMALAGASEAPFSYGYLKAWEALRVVDPKPCRPFSANRSGMSLGEGAAALVLEPLANALERKATIYAEVLGFCTNSNAQSTTRPEVEGAARCMQAALDDAGLSYRAIDYINAHGTGTALNDVCETQAIHQVFGSHARRLAVSSTKSMLGHALGASGALEAAATTLAIHHQILPPTIHLEVLDPECDLDYVSQGARAGKINCALTNSFAFGGLNACLVLGRIISG